MRITTSGCELEVERGPDSLLVRIKRLDAEFHEIPALAEQLWSLLERHFTYRLVLELDEVDVLRSYLIGQLLLLSQRVNEHDGMLRLCGLSSHNREVLHTACLDSRLPSYDSRVAAVMGAGPGKPR